MKPGDSVATLMAEAAMGTCGHVRQFDPFRPDVMLPCATPGCPWGSKTGSVLVRRPIVLADLPAPPPSSKGSPVYRLERAEAESFPDLKLGDVTVWPGRRFFLWRFA